MSQTLQQPSEGCGHSLSTEGTLRSNGRPNSKIHGHPLRLRGTWTPPNPTEPPQAHHPMGHSGTQGVILVSLQPANILLDEFGHVRISDLGLACDFSKKKPHASV